MATNSMYMPDDEPQVVGGSKPARAAARRNGVTASDWDEEQKRQKKLSDVRREVSRLYGGTDAPKETSTPSTPTYTIEEFVNQQYKTGDDSPWLTKKENDRRRRDNLITSIGDAVSAISSMYHSTRGGAPTYDPATGLNAASRKRYDDLVTQRKADYAQYLNAIKMADLNEWRTNNYKIQLQNARTKAYAAELKQKYDEGRLDIEEEKLKLKKEWQEHKISDDEWKNKIAELNAYANKKRADTGAKQEARVAGGSTKTTREGFDAEGNKIVTTDITYGAGGSNNGYSSSNNGNRGY